jgi:hypothetical protein
MTSTSARTSRWPIIARRTFTATNMVAALESVIAKTGVEPTYVRATTAPNFPKAGLIDLRAAAEVKTAYIGPECRWPSFQSGLTQGRWQLTSPTVFIHGLLAIPTYALDEGSLTESRRYPREMAVAAFPSTRKVSFLPIRRTRTTATTDTRG